MLSHPTPPHPNLWAGKRSVCIYNYKMKMMIWKESTTKWIQIQKGGPNPSCLYKKILAGNLYCSPSPPHFVDEIWRRIILEDFGSCSRILEGTIRTRLSCIKAALLCRRSVAQSSTEMRAHLGSADCYWFSLACTAPKVHQCTAAYQVQTKYCSCCSNH